LNVQASGSVALTGANKANTVQGSSVGDFGYNASGNMTLGSITSSTSISLSATGTGNITQPDGYSYIITPQLNVSTPGAVSIGGETNAIDALTATSVGSLTLSNPGDITLKTITLTGNYTGGGVIDVSSGYGTITVAQRAQREDQRRGVAGGEYGHHQRRGQFRRYLQDQRRHADAGCGPDRQPGQHRAFQPQNTAW
jgi:hypothetical protein